MSKAVKVVKRAVRSATSLFKKPKDGGGPLTKVANAMKDKKGDTAAMKARNKKKREKSTGGRSSTDLGGNQTVLGG